MEFFKKNKNCSHHHVAPDVDFAYCPDCGELIENQWYLLRCSCCGVKLKGIIKNGEIMPEKHFCHNCGTKEFVIERINKINFIDINYAVLVKAVGSELYSISLPFFLFLFGSSFAISSSSFVSITG